jgi:hypothetical protein
MLRKSVFHTFGSWYCWLDCRNMDMKREYEHALSLLSKVSVFTLEI